MRFPGVWEVRVMESNVPARDFWAHAISTFRGEAVKNLLASLETASTGHFSHLSPCASLNKLTGFDVRGRVFRSQIGR
jgi:hypothetical protein